MNKKVFFKVITWILVLAIIVTSLPASTIKAKEKQTQVQDNTKHQYIVVMKDKKSKDMVVDKIKSKVKIKKNNLGDLPAVSAEMTATEANDLLSNDNVDYIEPDTEVQISGEDFVPWNLEDVGVKPAHEEGLKGDGVKIAVLDTGVSEHPDITVAGSESFTGDSNLVDENGHGTAVIGVIAASENEIGILGGAPAAEIYSLKVMDKSGVGKISSIINAIEWCKQNDIDVINMSFGTDTYSRVLEEEINSAYESGILIVAAAGNNGKNTTDNVQYPAAYSSVIAVSAVDKANKVADFSSRGDAVDLCAPGVEVYTTSLGKSYESVSGTSYAAPHVAAVAALLWGKDKNKSNDFIRLLMNESAQQVGDKKEYGNGLVDVEQALSIYNTFNKNYVDGQMKDSWKKPDTKHGDREYEGDEGFVAVSGVVLEEAKKVESAHNYANNSNITSTIKKNGASRIRVHFTRMDTESGHDYITSSAGNNFSGSAPNGGWSSYATGNTITVTLKSDAANVGWGYAIDKISYEDDDLPSTPYKVLVSGRTSTSISLTWNKSNDSSGNITYDVYKQTTGGASTKIVSTTETNYTVTGITDNTLKYYVVARDVYGNTSKPSKLASATTKGITTTPDFKVYSKDSSGNYVQLTDGVDVPMRTNLYVTCHTGSSYMLLKYGRGIVRKVMNPAVEDSSGGFTYQPVYINITGTHDISLEYGDNCDTNKVTFTVNTISTPGSIAPAAQVSDAERLHFGEVGVNSGTGNFCYSVEDIDWETPAFKGGTLTRYYNSKDISDDSDMGIGWRNSFSGKITFATGKATVTMPDGSIKPYTVSSGVYSSDWTHDKLLSTGGTLTLGGKSIYYKLTLTDQSIYGYDSAGRLIAMADKYGNVTTIDLDSSGRVANVNGPTGRSLTFTYSASTGLLTTVTDDTDRIQTYYYNEKNQLVESVSSSCRPTYYFYDPDGYIRSYYLTKDVYGEEATKYAIESITYSNDKVATLTNEYGNTNTYTYGYNNISNRTRVTSTDGVVSDYDYNTRYYVTRYMDGLGAVSTNAYNNYGDTIQATDRLGNSYAYTVDTNGNVITTTNPDNGKRYYSYNSKNNITCESDTDLATSPTTFKNTTWYLYDTSGIYLQKKAVQAVDNVAAYSTSQNQDNYMITSWTYDSSSTFKGSMLTSSVRVNSSKTNTTTYTYNSEGSCLTETDPAGFVTKYDINNRGRIIKITKPSGENTVKQYDFEGNLLRESNYEADGDSIGTTRSYVDLSGRTMFTVSGENYNPANDGLYYIDDNTSATLHSVNIYYGTTDATFTTHTTENGNSLDITTVENGEETQTLYDKLGQVKES